MIEELEREHELVMEWLELLAEIAQRAGGDFERSPLALSVPSFLDFIENFVDRLHHGKEEKVLFETIGAPGVLVHCNPVPQMLHEHDLGRDLKRAMAAAVQEKKLPELAKSCLQFCELLSQHIFKENNILYPMALRDVPKENWPAMGARCLEIEKALDAPGLRNKYFEELNRLRGLHT